ncbi:hypothetical protein [Bacteroides pyogenes]|uniref:GREB1-related protein n=2 Tax=Bacteroides pyogenes TaxID=310300 RepID=UPI001BAB8E29|nr:hypothetical protein [Bacteroides pyogenes]MBR8725828.1 hypothetical protein [Bacteroides pyogenes]MBR8739464.1 hypothetical protein [Bacteroides pyogenes]MBR8754987.1 hypothetical protein [Bacteroides pyogenes]MBR8796294.1 hypothetical protein [Bacteroides pyogenes]MBR8809792.1 hypothetical protein [Bacteroides pyogenes]
MMRNNSFVALILTHGRPDKVYTVKTLRKCGYTGDIILVVDNEDRTIDEYKKKYDDVYVFDKKAVASQIDEGDNFNDRRAIIYARNAAFDIAKERGYRYFIELDDDYMEFSYTYNRDGEMKQRSIYNLDRVFDALVDFKNSTGAITVALAQRGDFVGGKGNNIVRGEILKRKAMNSFICDTERPFEFFGKINEDVNTYTVLGGRGELFFQVPHVSLNQMTTQQSDGGMTDIYLDSGTYVKSFYTVMYAPSCTKIRPMGAVYPRLHHSINWNNAVPKIIPESIKK